MLPRPESANPMSIQTTPRPGRALAVAVLAAACWAVPVAGTAAAQESAQEIQKLLAEIQATKDQTLQVRSQAIRPMKVNGVEVSPDRFRREAIFLVGAKTVEAKIAELFVAQEIQQLVASGRDAKDFEITDDEVDAELKREKEHAHEPESRIAEIFLSVDSPAQDQEVHSLAERLIAPGGTVTYRITRQTAETATELLQRAGGHAPDIRPVREFPNTDHLT